MSMYVVIIFDNRKRKGAWLECTLISVPRVLAGRALETWRNVLICEFYFVSLFVTLVDLFASYW